MNITPTQLVFATFSPNPAASGSNVMIAQLKQYIEKRKFSNKVEVSIICTSLNGREVVWISKGKKMKFSGKNDWIEYLATQKIPIDLLHIVDNCFSSHFFNYHSNKVEIETNNPSSYQELQSQLGNPPTVYTNVISLKLPYENILKAHPSYHSVDVETKGEALGKIHSLAGTKGWKVRIGATRLISAHELTTQNRYTCCVSNAQRVETTKLLGLQNKMSVIHPGTDMIKYDTKKTKEQAAALRKKYEIPADKKIVLFSGQVREFKGVYELAAAMKTLSVSGKKHALIFMGEATENAKKSLEETAGDQVQVIFTDLIERRQEVAAHYMMADVVASPTWEDSFNLPILEALAFGKPCVVSIHHATSELWIDTGLALGCKLIEDSSEDSNIRVELKSLTSALRTQLTQPPNQSKQENTKKLIQEKYTVTRMAEEYLEVYRKAIYIPDYIG